MQTEYRVIFTMTFNSDADRNTAHNYLKTTTVPGLVAAANSAGIVIKRADMTKDEYVIASLPMATEKVI
jgi:hypothetical protein